MQSIHGFISCDLIIKFSYWIKSQIRKKNKTANHTGLNQSADLQMCPDSFTILALCKLLLTLMIYLLKNEIPEAIQIAI